MSVDLVTKAVLWILDGVAEVDDRPIARHITLGCLLVGAIALLVLVMLFAQRR